MSLIVKELTTIAILLLKKLLIKYRKNTFIRRIQLIATKVKFH